jgi:hypothetical protein
MHPSLQAIAKKAREKRSYRFRNLYRLLNEEMLLDAWKRLNRRTACGVDRMTVEEYERNLVSNIRLLVQRLKQKRYKAKLVRRVYIPKGKDKLRPLGIPALEDKLVQTAAAEILSAIYEQDFLESSHGYRPHMGPRRAVQALTKELQFGNYTYVVEADIRGFFDEIDHEWGECVSHRLAPCLCQVVGLTHEESGRGEVDASFGDPAGTLASSEQQSSTTACLGVTNANSASASMLRGRPSSSPGLQETGSPACQPLCR